MKLLINSDKKIISFWFGVFISGFLILGLAITAGVSNQINKNFVTEFQKVGSQYAVQTHLDPDKNDYYIVASVKGNTRRSRILSADAVVQGARENRSSTLEAADSRSFGCSIIKFCKEQILRELSVNKGGTYKINISNFKSVDEVEILSLGLHSNHSILFQAVFISLGIILLASGLLMVIFSFSKFGYNKVLHRIKSHFGRFSR